MLQLKQILTAAGDDPGPMTNYFNGQTQFALAQWQAQHDYPNSTPGQPGVRHRLTRAGHRLQARATRAPPASSSARRPPRPPRPTTGSTDRTPRRGRHPGLATWPSRHRRRRHRFPSLTIQSVDDKVTQGQPATFVVTRLDGAQPAAVTVNLTTGGTAGSQDIVTPPPSAILAGGRHLGHGRGADPGERPWSRPDPDDRHVHRRRDRLHRRAHRPRRRRPSPTTTCPTLQITGGTTVAPGAAGHPHHHRQPGPAREHPGRTCSFGGQRPAGHRLRPGEPGLTLPRREHVGHRHHQHPRPPRSSQPNKYIVVSIARPRRRTRSHRRVRPSSPSAAPPPCRTVTLSSATTYLQKGEPYEVTRGPERGLSTAVTIHLTYGGTARAGHRLHRCRPGTSSSRPARPSLHGQPSRPSPTTSSSPTGCSPCPWRRTRLPVGTPSSASVTIDLDGGADAHHLGQHHAITQGGAAIVRHHRQPGAGEEHHR